ncbi:MAG: 4Fe-4S dicluster domain-containing protein, partial [Catenulispora sp.]
MNPIVTTFLLLAGITAFVYTMYGRLFALSGMKWTNRFDNPGERLKGLLLFGLGQKRMVDPEERTPGTMHVLIFAAFLVLALRTIMLFSMGFSETLLRVLSTPTDRFWAHREGARAVFEAYLFAKDLVALGAVVGSVYFIYLRKVVKPDRMTRSWEAMLILGFIIGLMLSEYLFSASQMVLQQRGFTWTEPVTSGVAMLVSGLPARALWFVGGLAFWTHLSIILTFLNFLPLGKHFHVITGLPNVFVRRLGPSGKLPTPDLEKEDFGAKTLRDLHWKNGLDLYSCTECGRCQTHCPTYITGKPLTHKGVNQDLKHFVWEHQDQVGGYQTHGTETPELPAIVGNILKADTVWACTSCGWCEQACPVFIENIPRLIDMRRYKVQVDAEFPPEIQRVFEGIERQGNPWGIS